MDERETLIEAVGRAIGELGTATHLMDEAATARLGINDTDRRLVRLLFVDGRMSAGRLASGASLSPGATTAAIDRLERAGLARRIRASEDRRGVLVELTPEGRARIEAIYYEPVARLGLRWLTRYTDEELHTLLGFLRGAYQFQVEQAQRIRSDGSQQEGREG